MGFTDKLQRGISGNPPLEFTKKLVVYCCLYSRFSSTMTATPYWAIASRYHTLRHGTNLRKHDVDIDPFAYRWIDPDNITRFTGREGTPRRKEDLGRVMGGDWDKTLPDQSHRDPLRRRKDYFEDHIVFKSLRNHFQRGIPWKETGLVKFALKEVRAGRRCWGSDTVDEIHERCKRIDQLYEAIDRDEYRTKQDLLGIYPSRFFCYLDETVDRYGDVDHLTRTGHNTVRGYRGIKTNEVLVDISRHGEYLFVDGRHRLTIAKLLDIERIPVVMMVRHKKWVQSSKTIET